MKGLINSTAFKSLSKETQNLYYTLSSLADDSFLKPRAYPYHAYKSEMDSLLEHKFLVRYKNGYLVVTSEIMREYLLSLANEEQPKQLKLDTNDNAIHINIVDEFIKIYQAYPCSIGKSKKSSLNLYYGWLTGKSITVMGQKKTVKYNHIQIAIALKMFIETKSGTDEQFIPRLPTFLGERLLCDYITATSESYETYMKNRFGDDWQKVKFAYDRESV